MSRSRGRVSQHLSADTENPGAPYAAEDANTAEHTTAEATENYYLRLDDASLIFFPRDGGKNGIVVQVLVILGPGHGNVSTVEMALDFYAVQREVTDAARSILYAHIVSGLPEQITYEGNSFFLHGVRKEWKYGQRLRFAWGANEVQACSDKWVFTFEPK